MGSLSGEVEMKKPVWLYPKVHGHNPPERWGHSAVAAHALLYVFGGCCGGRHFSDVLILNRKTMSWGVIATTGRAPGPRDSHSAVLIENRMVVFGGTDGSRKVNDLHVLDLDSKEWSQPYCAGAPPSPRESHTMTLMGKDRLVVFGGSGEGEGNYLNDLHVLDLCEMRWSSPEVKGEVPDPRDSHSAVAVGNKLVVYGGDRGDRYHGEVEVFDMETLTWSKLAVEGPSPGGRAGHAAVNIGTKVYVIGGVGDRHYYNDVWVLDLRTCSWTCLSVCGQPPQGRFSHATAVIGSNIMIYGGCGEDERPLNELLILLLEGHQQSGQDSAFICKTLGHHWVNQKRRFLRSCSDMNPGWETEATPFWFISGNVHQARKRRSMNSKPLQAEVEQEEHSLSISHHSSPSHSDQEHPPVHKPADSENAFPPFGQLNSVNGRQMLRQSYLAVSQSSPSVHSLVGADVQGKVDGVFDSGLLMTATVDGKTFRGVLFPPGPGVVSRGPTMALPPAPACQPFPKLSCERVDHRRGLQGHGESDAAEGLFQGMRVASGARKERRKLRSDLQGVVLTLGSPGN